MKFDFVIGNPPYQDETIGDNKGYAPPVYYKFFENAYKIGDVAEMIHPARFLFNAGSTPKQWNEQMLQETHLIVLYFEQDSSKVFSNTDIKGGVVITHYDNVKDYGAIILDYIKTTMIEEKVVKVDGKAEADRFFNYRIMLWKKHL